MFDFGNYLWQDEEILYEGKAVVKAANKQIFIILGIEAVLIIMFIFFVKNFSEMADQTGVVGTFLMIIVLVLFICLLAYAFVYNCFIKDKKIAEVYYCLTNRKVMKYDGNTQEFVCGSLSNYKTIYTSNLSQNGSFGDVHFEMPPDENEKYDSKQALEYFKNTVKNVNPNEKAVIVFESIANPVELWNLAKKAYSDAN